MIVIIVINRWSLEFHAAGQLLYGGVVINPVRPPSVLKIVLLGRSVAGAGQVASLLHSRKALIWARKVVIGFNEAPRATILAN